VTRDRRAFGILLATLCLSALAGCASAPAQRPAAENQALSGRLSVRVDATASTPAQNVSGLFELEGAPAAGQLSLSTPLGTMMARARWTPDRAWLTTSDGETSFPDLASLTHQMLGESLPVAALFDWLRGRPWPGAPSRARPADGGRGGFQQLGWNVDLARFDEGWVSAEREQLPHVSVRARLDPP
jgi:outer membrane lipoprotein LolB